MMSPKTPIVIAHRGASGYRPEHTLAAYELAIEMGADFIEPDLVSTKDGELIARHENEISETTDVAERPEFASRKTTKEIDGKMVTGWFTEDFTLAEIKTLKAKERLPFRDRTYNGFYEIPTFQEIIDLVQDKSKEFGRTIGIYPETKHPTYFRSIGLPLEERLVYLLTNNGYCDANSPIFIQSFEVANLQQIKQLTNLPLIQLIEQSNLRPYDFVVKGDKRTYSDLITPTGLSAIAQYAKGIGVNKRLIVPQGEDKRLRQPTSLIENAHRAGLLVHAWTFRSEACYLALDYNGKPEAEYEQFWQLGVDGIFSDFPDIAFSLRNQLMRK